MNKPICIVTCSRERALKCAGNLIQWYARSNLDVSKTIVSIDQDDSQIVDYHKFFSNITVLTYKNKTMVEAFNRCLSYIPDDAIVISAFDDIIIKTENWDEKLQCLEPGNLGFVSCEQAQDFQPIVCGHASVFKEWGYLYYPGYISMYADNDYTDRGILENRFVDVGIEIVHKHPVFGTAPNDPTYEKQNSQAAYRIGKMVYERRKKHNFEF